MGSAQTHRDSICSLAHGQSEFALLASHLLCPSRSYAAHRASRSDSTLRTHIFLLFIYCFIP